MICPICQADLQMNDAVHSHKTGSKSPNVVCTAPSCDFMFTEHLHHHEHAVVLEMNAFTKHNCRARSAEAALAKKFNFRQVF